jgi:DNA/RNA-binding domain of Phe-tRNA-synthetase-like protein
MIGIQIELPDLKLGVVEADGVHVAPSDADLTNQMDEACERIRREFTVESLADAERIRAVRSMFRAWGVDPSKYRPSSEALLRRVVQGKGLYRVSNLVDIGNLGSVETAWPFGCYDRARISPPIVFRHGVAGESYEGIRKRIWHLQGRPVLSDTEGPFGSPISDSIRSMIIESTRDILAVIYAPFGSREASLKDTMARFCDRLSRFGGASATRASICR